MNPKLRRLTWALSAALLIVAGDAVAVQAGGGGSNCGFCATSETGFCEGVQAFESTCLSQCGVASVSGCDEQSLNCPNPLDPTNFWVNFGELD